MEAGNFKDALSLLEKSLKMSHQVMGEDHVDNCDIYSVMASVYTKMKEYDSAKNYLSIIWELNEARYGRKCEQIGKVYIELAKV